MANEKNIFRRGNRRADEVRPVSFVYNPFGFAPSSVLYRAGDTIVLVSVSLTAGVPPFLRGKGEGWLTAEYEMLPVATRKRTQRESTQAQRNSRSVEISRLVGRVFRSVFDVTRLGEHTVHIDCDILQADGGTRTAAIAAVSLALSRACEKWRAAGIIPQDLTVQKVGAISVGAKDGVVLLDLDQDEDNVVDADFNFVMTSAGEIIEIQGTCEKKPVGPDVFQKFYEYGQKGIRDVFTLWEKNDENAPEVLMGMFKAAVASVNDEILKPVGKAPLRASSDHKQSTNKPGMFSLGNRIQKK